MMLRFFVKNDLIISIKHIKALGIVFYLLIITLLFGCVSSTEESILLLENRLESFIGKSVRDVINSFGNPTKYSNRMDLPGQESGTYMIYDYRPMNDDCIIMFKYAKKTLKIIDWDYEGNCLLFDGK